MVPLAYLRWCTRIVLNTFHIAQRSATMAKQDEGNSEIHISSYPTVNSYIRISTDPSWVRNVKRQRNTQPNLFRPTERSCRKHASRGFGCAAKIAVGKPTTFVLGWHWRNDGYEDQMFPNSTDYLRWFQMDICWTMSNATWLLKPVVAIF